MSKIQIIIPCINLWEKYTKQCIESIKTTHDYRILLIDNASTDETLVEAGKLVSNTFSHLRNNEKLSCAQSWNVGVKDAFERGYEYVLILNNDIILHPTAIDTLVKRFEKGDAAMVTCMDVRGETTPDALQYITPNPETPEAEHPNFSAFMISTEYWDKIGEFDEEFFPAYFEDNDAHYRMKLAGLRAIVLPTALFYHYGSRTQNEASGTGAPIVSSPAFERNRWYYTQKWGGPPGQERYTIPFNKI